ncbi:MAG TPA: transketolase [Candidatus Thermoplasmatota archaeon]|nr:transketolase [Candidatus Thermoplasmatota archaeon]
MFPLALAPARPDLADLKEAARQVRLDVLRMTHKAQSGHPGGSFSMAELVVALYATRLRVDPKAPKAPARDRFILSKGHTCPALYAVLAERGFFSRDEFKGLRRAGHLLQGHSDHKIPGVDMSAGSLGMGLGFANGVALGQKLQGHADTRVWVMMGDGECQEGSVWESAMTTPFRKLDRVTAIVDVNQIQIDGFTKDVKDVEPLADKWRAFGWDVVDIDGHDFRQILSAYEYADSRVGSGKPVCILARTKKGAGVSFMELKSDYHGRALTDDEMRRAFAELGESAWEGPTAPQATREGPTRAAGSAGSGQSFTGAI